MKIHCLSTLWAAALVPLTAATLPLAELDLGLMTTGWGKPQAAKSVDGNPLRMGGRQFQTGIGSHADSEFLIRLDGKADEFRDVLKMGRSEMLSGGRRKEALLADAMEAVIAAVYLDAGFEAARAMVLRLWGPRIGAVEPDARDAKTALQEWAQARGMPPPAYVETGRTGPDHQPVFTVRVTLENGAGETAQAGSKRAAEHLAAKALLTRMEAGHD